MYPQPAQNGSAYAQHFNEKNLLSGDRSAPPSRFQSTQFALSTASTGTLSYGNRSSPKKQQPSESLLYGGFSGSTVRRQSNPMQDESYYAGGIHRTRPQGHGQQRTGYNPTAQRPASPPLGYQDSDTWLTTVHKKQESLIDEDVTLSRPQQGLRYRGHDSQMINDGKSNAAGYEPALAIERKEFETEDEDDDEPPPTRSLLDDGADISHTAGAPNYMSKDEERLRESVRSGNSSHANLTSSAIEQERWGRWVVAFGFNADTEEATITELKRCGKIKEHARAQGNWIFVRFETRLQAEKAICKNGTLLSPSVMLGVIRLDAQIAARLKFRLTPAGAGEVLKETQTIKGQNIERSKRKLADSDVDDILIRRNPRDSVCNQLLKYVFNW